MAVLFLSELEDCAVIKTTEKGFGLLVGMEFDGSDFGFFDSFVRLLGKRCFLVDVLRGEPEGLEFDEFHEEEEKTTRGAIECL